jgi:hypothetical protein
MPVPPKGLKLKKVIIPYEEENPEVEPLFANYFHVLSSGSDVYVDVGLIPADELASAKDGSTVKFVVLSRIAMSPASLALLHGLAGDELARLQQKNDASTNNPIRARTRRLPRSSET